MTMTDEPTLEIKARIDSLTVSIAEVTKGEHPEVIFSSLMSALANFLAHIENVDAALGDLQDGLPELESLTRRIRAKMDSGEENEVYT
jgi:septation ring formation regulator EzrA